MSTGSAGDKLQIKLLTTEEDARRVSEFFLSDRSFDDTNHTPGEQEHFRKAPRESLVQSNHFHWFAETEDGIIVGATSCKENEHQTGGYLWDYLAVHRNYRKLGIAARLYEELERHVKEAGARFILTYTCSLPEYGPIQNMFRQRGFELIGTYPDYYYDGENRLAYFKRLT
ncbi:GNAT family N-acetyltransferase [Paenibacillus sp. TAB 01]|uniref:GNAT family N-acetyltransferase n=1 Tax=Paenibacillus sp. TAB 01 TaxID=3368988 RepID=UPI003751BA01